MNINGETLHPNQNRDCLCRWGQNCPTHTTALTTIGGVHPDLIEVDGSIYFHKDHRAFADFDLTKGKSYPSETQVKYDCGWGDSCGHTMTTSGELPDGWHIVWWVGISVDQLYIDGAHFDLVELDDTDTVVTYSTPEGDFVPVPSTLPVKRYVNAL